MCSTEAFLDKWDIPLANLTAPSGDEQPPMCAEAESMDTVSPMDTLLDPYVVYGGGESISSTSPPVTLHQHSPDSPASEYDSPAMGMDAIMDASDVQRHNPVAGLQEASRTASTTCNKTNTRDEEEGSAHCNCDRRSPENKHASILLSETTELSRETQPTRGAKRKSPEDDEYVERPPKKIKCASKKTECASKKTKRAAKQRQPAKKFPCTRPGCEESFTRRGDLLRHQLGTKSCTTNGEAIPKRYFCGRCRMGFHRGDALARHVRSKMGCTKFLNGKRR
ncbi:predicted protein [Postia placenta Mad-698-R]|nr:predicted protein [Postia placenta Mad-698-R]